MQDIHPMGVGGRFLGGGGGGGGERRLRPNHHQQQNHHQALKCPRCDSLNTKFCYYNNYNLSQPRHFCKNCRRYWTKGGVLRNVPVGGGCRKSKRSSKSKTKENKSSSHSSSESSSVTATTTTATTATAAATTTTEVVSSNSFLNFPDSNFLENSSNLTYDQPQTENTVQFQQDMGGFTNNMVPSSKDLSVIGLNAPSYNHKEEQQQQQQWEELKMGAGFMTQTGRVDEFARAESNNELLDWQAAAGGENGLFDLTGTVDQSYWSQTQWDENDHSLNFLP